MTRTGKIVCYALRWSPQLTNPNDLLAKAEWMARQFRVRADISKRFLSDADAEERRDAEYDVMDSTAAAELIDRLAARVRELEAEMTSVHDACLAVCRDNNPDLVGEDAIDPEAGCYVCQNEDGAPIIDTDSPAVVIAALDRLWVAQQERAEKAETDLAALRADRERLDWLALHPAQIAYWDNTQDGDVFRPCGADYRPIGPPMPLCAAIDAARKEATR